MRAAEPRLMDWLARHVDSSKASRKKEGIKEKYTPTFRLPEYKYTRAQSTKAEQDISLQNVGIW